MIKLDDLVAQHHALRKQSGQDRKLAEIEDRIFRLPDAPAHPQAIKWASALLGETLYAMRIRRDLLRAGDTVDPLWVLLSNGLAIGTVCDIMACAKRRSRISGSTMRYDEERLRTALTAEIRDRNLTHMLELFSGSDDASGADAEEKPGAEPGAERPAPRRRIPDVPGPGEHESATEFWARIRRAVRAFAATQAGLPELPEHERGQMLRELDTDMVAVFDQHRQKWSRQKRRDAAAHAVTRTQFRNALLVLHMDPPRRGDSLAAVYAQARKQSRSLARVYHPDSNGGSEEMLPQYQAVIEAVDVVRRYVDEHKNDAAAPSTPTLRVVHGEKE